LTGFGFPVRGKGFVEFDVQLAGGVVRDVEQADRGLGLHRQTRQGQGQKCRELKKRAFGGHEVTPENHIKKLMGWILEVIR
jgi:hypothetical protein